jgi:hypothetical protein
LLVQGLREHADDPEFQQKWADVKAIAKSKAIARISELTGVQISDNVLLDIQVCHSKDMPSSCGMAHTSSGAISGGTSGIDGTIVVAAGEEDTRVQEAAAQRAGHHLEI